ncbi:MAG: class I SAM-dependent methyltransferase, partial [Thermodesulfobacteriota bacterium]|nr:class I SAM-dependent methyltransferase [Thermodesulfobacteriota bacterium]
MEKPGSGFHFKLMSFGFKLRDLFSPRKDVLKEVGIRPGRRLLDYGCGPGSYIPPAAELVGASGKVYALDINPLAVRRVQKIASAKGLANVEAVCSDRRTGLPDSSLDAVLLYDTFHT